MTASFLLSPQQVTNVWNHWWAVMMKDIGGQSLLHLVPLEPELIAAINAPAPVLVVPEPEPIDQSEPKSAPMYKPPKSSKPYSSARIRKPRKKISQEEREERKTKREAARLADDIPLADWAKNIMGDERISDITFQNMLDGIDNYFEIFDQLRRVDLGAYAYFSRVGAPLILDNLKVWRGDMEAPRIPDPSVLPSFVGAFFASTRDEYRKAILEEKAFVELNYFHKAKNFATAAAPGTTVYLHHMVGLKRDNLFSKEEYKKFPEAKHNYGVWFPLGVGKDGVIKALPCHMQHHQRLPRGGTVHHSSFEIPEGVAEMGKGDAHEAARKLFIMTIVATASVVSGLQITIQKGKTTARFGIPISHAKTFFADRLPEYTDSGRKKSILHLRLPTYRIKKDGSLVRVGEHLRGERDFVWRGYRITVGVPGIHYPSPEGLDADIYLDPKKDSDALPLDNAKELIPVGSGRMMNKYDKIVWGGKKVPFRRGEPTRTYSDSVLPELGKK